MCIKKTIANLISLLSIDEQFLCNMLGISDKTLGDWKNNNGNIIRLITLNNVVKKIKDLRPKLGSKEILLILKNSKMSYNFPPLMNSILANDDPNKNYTQEVLVAIEDFELCELDKNRNVIPKCPLCGLKVC